MRLTRMAAMLAATMLATPPLGWITPAAAQGNQQWFVPGQGGGQARPPAANQQRPPAGGNAQQRPPAARAPEPTPPQAGAEHENEAPSTPVQLPPMPEVPNIARGAAPPGAIIGVFGFRDVARASVAVQQLERTLVERRDRLNQDVQKEQTAWRDLQQQLASQRATLSPEQIRTKERELQERVTKAQRQFRDRQRVLQEAYQYGVAQVERVTGQILRQVAESRGMNVVLSREQVPLSAAEFDVTDAVVAQLNKVMTNVIIPPDGVPLAQFAPAMPPQVSPTAGSSAAPAAISGPAITPGPASATPPTQR